MKCLNWAVNGLMAARLDRAGLHLLGHAWTRFPNWQLLASGPAGCHGETVPRPMELVGLTYSHVSSTKTKTRKTKTKRRHRPPGDTSFCPRQQQVVASSQSTLAWPSPQSHTCITHAHLSLDLQILNLVSQSHSPILIFATCVLPSDTPFASRSVT